MGLDGAAEDTVGLGVERDVGCSSAEAAPVGLIVGLHAQSTTTNTHDHLHPERRFDSFFGIVCVTG